MSSKQRTLFLTQVSLLVAVQAVLTATPLGYIPVGLMDITIMHLPTLVGAIVLGPKAGVLLGSTFGLTSIIMATIRPRFTGFVYSPFVPGGNWTSALIALVPRIALGLIAWALFALLVRLGRSEKLAAAVAAGVATLCHTILVLGGIYLLFGPQYAAVFEVDLKAMLGILAGLVASNGLVEAAIAVLVCGALVTPLRRAVRR